MVKHVISCILQSQNTLRHTLIFFYGFWFLQIEALKFLYVAVRIVTSMGRLIKTAKTARKFLCFTVHIKKCQVCRVLK